MTTKIASVLTLGILGTMVFTILSVAAYFFGTIDAPTILLLTFLVNFLAWIFSPIFNDLIYRLIYKIKFYKKDEFESISPEIVEYISNICSANKIKFPKIGVIDDDNPTAFTYGSLPSNARLVFSKGIFTYLNKGEVEAVVAHEIGHIVHYDFLVMTIANTMVQILYEVYAICISSKKGGKNDNKGLLVYVGLVSYVFYMIATYVLLFLSRTREYYADEFSAKTTGRPNDLSSALIKIAYGMVTLESDVRTKRLLESSRAMGIMDPHSAKGIGMISQISGSESGQIGQVLAYDFISPWATISELSSTHPLTGKRIQKLDEISMQMGKEQSYNIRGIINNMVIDKRKLFRGFYLGAFIYYLPNISIILGIVAILAVNSFSPLLFLLGLSLIIKTLYKFSNRKIEATTLLDLMSDIYASPIKGRKVELSGQIIGRGEPGAYLSEDLMFRDNSGIIYLDYTSKYGSLGNLFFALKKVSRIISQEVTLEGWFFRSNYQMISVGKINAITGVIKSHPRLWGILGGAFCVFLSLFV
jgi:Zn-dependent protease with chaperone function